MGMKEVFYLETMEQIKAISHPFRMEILKTFSLEREDNPLTAKMIAEALEETPSKIHYHLKELVNAGILEVVDTREINGITERFYQPVAKRLTVEKKLLEPGESREGLLQMVLDLMEHARRSIVKQLNQSGREKDVEVDLSSRVMHILPDEEKLFHKELTALLEKYDHRENPEAKPIEWLMIMYPHELRKKN